MSEEETGTGAPEGPGVPLSEGGIGMTGFVSVGKPLAAGGVYAADREAAATKLPVDASTALDVAFANLGLVSDEGLTNGLETETQNIVDWRGVTVLTVKTAQTETFQWTFIETSEDVLKEVYGADNVTENDGALTVIHNDNDRDRRSYVFEIAMTGDRVKRIVVPNAQVTTVGEVKYVRGEPIGYQVTVTCMPDAAGNTVYEYIAAVGAGD